MVGEGIANWLIVTIVFQCLTFFLVAPGRFFCSTPRVVACTYNSVIFGVELRNDERWIPVGDKCKPAQGEEPD